MSYCELFQDGVGGNSPVNHSRFATTGLERRRILERYRRIAMVGLFVESVPPEPFRGDLPYGRKLRCDASESARG